MHDMVDRPPTGGCSPCSPASRRCSLTGENIKPFDARLDWGKNLIAQSTQIFEKIAKMKMIAD